MKDKKEELERDLEQWFRKQVVNLGGRSYKFVSPGNSGVPDRIVIWPGGKVDFVELKTTTGHLGPVQNAQIRRLKALGARVFVVYGRHEADTYLQNAAMYLKIWRRA